MKKYGILAGLLLAAFISCKTTQPSISPATAVPSLAAGPAWAALWQQQSGEYKALCLQAYQLAAWKLDQYLAAKGNKPLAVVTDIDETVLDNSPYSVHQALKGKSYDPGSWKEWTAKAAADTVPGAPAFFKYAASKGVAVFYITNREESERAATLKNLQRYGFPDADEQHLLLKSTTSGKEPRRQQVAAQYDIVLLFGDNLGDFSEIFDKKPFEQRNSNVLQAAGQFGSRFIVLPNPMYGDWEGALYNFQYKLTPQQKDSILRSRMKNY
ncbi:5'-nucleotidase (lipoprotein e(P4) family) [Chitinophaga terrae (ex Kim and Jung 2007)]|jgi:5'-nucleotidase (lipoprotein e(P4) family)|uniref:5'-nucleotidase, lipoprotein e(P4) family n=1 Tax=Chitinophaga terrae (ex Kim and Jung 2007) TaxID=408074 RepID=UPI0027816216|nr:5'-nucleotidase, lipoprotein e(P4) family [Chitinophaga terrae (ex Kim and Jung 2007)]MDQ0107760.1 5'-nucleotidase (lipoprotein e(P4) family) [Chitinophaga terrae (ex Kim and Jung 2007)]